LNRSGQYTKEIFSPVMPTIHKSPCIWYIIQPTLSFIYRHHKYLPNRRSSCYTP